MSDDAEINRDSIQHAYQQIADVIAARIGTGTYTIRLPSEVALAEEFDVANQTVRHAMATLRERGLIVSIHGRGAFVAACFSLEHG